MKKPIIFLAIVFIAGILALVLSKASHRQNPDRIPISGNIEVTEVENSFEIPGRVEQRFVDEGDIITKDQIIATLDPTEWRQEVAVKKAEVALAEAALLELENGYLPEEVAQAQARLQQTEADLKRLQEDFKRQQSLFQNNVISRREFEAVEGAYQVAVAKNKEAQESLAYLARGIRQEKIDQAQARLEEANHALSIAQIKLGYTVLKSPLDGIILSKNIEPGEYVVPGIPIVTTGDFGDTWLRAFIDETDLGRIKLGQAVEVKTDTFPDKVYPGKIVFISSKAEFTPKNVQTPKERVKLVYRIKIDLDNSSQELKPGMPADGWISLDEEQ